MKIILAVNSKGGCGKSTLIANLSVEFVNRKHKVLLLDLDPQKTLTQWWNERESAYPQLQSSSVKDALKFIHEAQKEFDFILVDTAGDFSNEIEMLLNLVDLAIVPCRPTPADFRAVGRTLEILKKNNTNFLFVLTQAIPNSFLSIQAAAKLSKFGKVIPTNMIHRVSYAKAMYSGIGAANIDNNVKKEMGDIYFFINEILSEEL